MKNTFTWIFASAMLLALPICITAEEKVSKASADAPVKVFILAGQSNMEGAGAVKMNPDRNEGKGTLEYLVKSDKTKDQLKHTVDANGDWVVREDVKIWYLDRKGGLSVGYGAGKDRIGPEFQFGHVIGQHFEEPVLLIKTAWGGKSLEKDFRPPSSGGEVGPYYKEMLKHIKAVLGSLDKEFPEFKGRKYEIVGFGWHQGWNDGCSHGPTNAYEANMVNFIKDVRKDLGVKDLPFVIADSGFGGRNQKVDRRLKIRAAQAAAAAHKDFKGTAACIQTQDFFRPADQSPSRHGFHWNCNAETYFLIGDAMGKEMIRLLDKK